MKKESVIILLILLSGLYTLTFGIITMVSFREMWWNGLALVGIGLFCLSLSLLAFLEHSKSN